MLDRRNIGGFERNRITSSIQFEQQHSIIIHEMLMAAAFIPYIQATLVPTPSTFTTRKAPCSTLTSSLPITLLVYAPLPQASIFWCRVGQEHKTKNERTPVEVWEEEEDCRWLVVTHSLLGRWVNVHNHWIKFTAPFKLVSKWFKYSQL